MVNKSTPEPSETIGPVSSGNIQTQTEYKTLAPNWQKIFTL